MKALLLIARLIFGAFMLANGANHFFLHLGPEPVGHTPLAVQLMSALVHSRLIEVAYTVQLVAGALILVNLLAPLALCIVMPISVCAAFWAVILDRVPSGAFIALVALALNAALMFACIDRYRDMLVRHARTIGEEEGGNYENRFVDPRGRTGQRDFILALIPLALVAAFYHWLVRGGSGDYAMLVLLFPAIMLHARRLHDMGKTGWLLLIPAIPTAAGIWFHMYDKGQGAEPAVIGFALGLSGVFICWGLVGKSKAAA